MLVADSTPQTCTAHPFASIPPSVRVNGAMGSFVARRVLVPRNLSVTEDRYRRRREANRSGRFREPAEAETQIGERSEMRAIDDCHSHEIDKHPRFVRRPELIETT